MRYADISIKCETVNDRFEITTAINKMHRDAFRVELKLNRKISCEFFEIKRSWTRRPQISIDEFRIPSNTLDILESTTSPVIELPVEDRESRPYLIRRDNLYIFFYRFIMALYYWDMRCQRSVNVNNKLKEEMPLKIDFCGKFFTIPMEQMVTFAEFIKQ